MRNRLGRFATAFARGARGVALGVYRHDCLGLAAQIAYSTLFSLFPFLLFVRALVAYLPATEKLGTWLLRGLERLVNADSRLYQIVERNVFEEVNAVSVALLSVGVVLTLWSASGAVMVLIKSVNRAYGLNETRPWARRRVMAAGLAVAGAVLILADVLLVVFGSWLGELIGREVGFDSVLHQLWVGLRWPVVSILLVAAIAAFFSFAPNARQKWYSVLPGAFFTVAAIIGSSVGLSWFLSQSVFQVRWLTYGAIGTAIVLLFWAFLTGLMVLVGGEINAAVRRAVDSAKAVAGGLIESPHDE